MGLRDVEDPTLFRQSAHRWRLGCQPYAPVGLDILEKINDLIGTRTPRYSGFSIAPQPFSHPVPGGFKYGELALQIGGGLK
jgi:hypothetical protein